MQYKISKRLAISPHNIIPAPAFLYDMFHIDMRGIISSIHKLSNPHSLALSIRTNKRKSIFDLLHVKA